MRRVSAAWQTAGLLDGMQYAFQAQKGVESPLRITCAVAEDAYLYRKLMRSVSQDILGQMGGWRTMTGWRNYKRRRRGGIRTS